MMMLILLLLLLCLDGKELFPVEYKVVKIQRFATPSDDDDGAGVLSSMALKR